MLSLIKSNQYYKRFVNFISYNRNRLYTFGAFSTAYTWFLYTNRNHKNEVFRLALAGSLANMFWDVLFHFADTVNTRSKLNTHHVSTYFMINKIYMEEGLYGLSKGISAGFYGSIACGFIYFSLYKTLKTYMFQKFDGKLHSSLIFLTAAFFSEWVTLLVYYPFDMIKSRLQTSNKRYKYKNLLHAFRKEITENGILSLYKGGSSYLIMFATMISWQFCIYESLIKYLKNKYLEEYRKREALWIISSSWIAGAVGSAITNGFEVIVVTRQTQPESKVIYYLSLLLKNEL